MTAKQILGLHVIHHDGQLDGHRQQEPKSGANEVEAAQEMSKLSAMAQWFQKIGCSHVLNLSEPIWTTNFEFNIRCMLLALLLWFKEPPATKEFELPFLMPSGHQLGSCGTPFGMRVIIFIIRDKKPEKNCGWNNRQVAWNGNKLVGVCRS